MGSTEEQLTDEIRILPRGTHTAHCQRSFHCNLSKFLLRMAGPQGRSCDSLE